MNKKATERRTGIFGRRPHRVVKITMPAPPTNGLEYLTWRDGAGRTIKAADMGGVPGRVSVTIRAGISPKGRDLDTIMGPLLDALAGLGVIESAAKVTRIVAEWSAEIQSGSVAVEVRQISGPHTRQRIALAAREREAMRLVEASL